MQSADLSRARELAEVARQVLDLDAEDFTAISRRFDAAWAGRLADSSFPAQPRDPIRGALGSLVPLYELMLEVLQIRALRREPLQVVVTAHLIGEYLIQLAWESTFGHGGDPLRLADFVGEQPVGDRGPHLPALVGAAEHRAPGAERLLRRRRRLHHLPRPVPLPAGGGLRGLRARTSTSSAGASDPTSASHARSMRASSPSWGARQRRDLDARIRLAMLYIDSPIVALRHHAPVGHFFGVPSVTEISEAWLRTWEKVSAPWPDGANPVLAPTLEARAPAGEALPGLSALVSAVAGRPDRPGPAAARHRE